MPAIPERFAHHGEPTDDPTPPRELAVPPFIAPTPARDPLDNLFSVVKAVEACAGTMTKTGPRSPDDEQLLEWERQQQRAWVLLTAAVQAVRAVNYAPRATMGEVKSWSQGCVTAAINVMKVAPRDCTSPPWPWITLTSDSYGRPVPPCGPNEWRARAASILADAMNDLELVRAPAGSVERVPAVGVSAAQQAQTYPWSEKDLDDLQQIPRTLLLRMLDREEADLAHLCHPVWGESVEDLKPSALPMALTKINAFLARHGYPRELKKSRGEDRLRWE